MAQSLLNSYLFTSRCRPVPYKVRCQYITTYEQHFTQLFDRKTHMVLKTQENGS
jgi:hypothetical protein